MFEEKRIIFLNSSSYDNPSPGTEGPSTNRIPLDLGEKPESKETTEAISPEQEKAKALKESADKAMAVMNDLNDLRFLLPRLSDSKDQDWATKRFLKQIDDFFTGPEGQNKEGAIGTLERISQKAGSSEGLQEGELESYTEEITALVETANEFLSSLEGRLSENFEKNYEDNKDKIAELKEEHSILIDKKITDGVNSFQISNLYRGVQSILLDGKETPAVIENIAKINYISTYAGLPEISYISLDGREHKLSINSKPEDQNTTPELPAGVNINPYTEESLRNAFNTFKSNPNENKESAITTIKIAIYEKPISEETSNYLEKIASEVFHDELPASTEDIVAPAVEETTSEEAENPILDQLKEKYQDLEISEDGKISFTLGGKKRSYKDSNLNSQNFSSQEEAERALLEGLWNAKDLSKGEEYKESNLALYKALYALLTPEQQIALQNEFKEKFPKYKMPKTEEDTTPTTEPSATVEEAPVGTPQTTDSTTQKPNEEAPQNNPEIVDGIITINGRTITNAKYLDNGNISGEQIRPSNGDKLEGEFNPQTGQLLKGKITIKTPNNDTGTTQEGNFDEEGSLEIGKKTFSDGSYFEGTFSTPTGYVQNTGYAKTGKMINADGSTINYENFERVEAEKDSVSAPTKPAPVENSPSTTPSTHTTIAPSASELPTAGTEAAPILAPETDNTAIISPTASQEATNDSEPSVETEQTLEERKEAIDKILDKTSNEIYEQSISEMDGYDKQIGLNRDEQLKKIKKLLIGSLMIKYYEKLKITGTNYNDTITDEFLENFRKNADINALKELLAENNDNAILTFAKGSTKYMYLRPLFNRFVDEIGKKEQKMTQNQRTKFQYIKDLYNISSDYETTDFSPYFRALMSLNKRVDEGTDLPITNEELEKLKAELKESIKPTSNTLYAMIQKDLPNNISKETVINTITTLIYNNTIDFFNKHKDKYSTKGETIVFFDNYKDFTDTPILKEKSQKHKEFKEDTFDELIYHIQKELDNKVLTEEQFKIYKESIPDSFAEKKKLLKKLSKINEKAKEPKDISDQLPENLRKNFKLFDKPTAKQVQVLLEIIERSKSTDTPQPDIDFPLDEFGKTLVSPNSNYEFEYIEFPNENPQITEENNKLILEYTNRQDKTKQLEKFWADDNGNLKRSQN